MEDLLRYMDSEAVNTCLSYAQMYNLYDRSQQAGERNYIRQSVTTTISCCNSGAVVDEMHLVFECAVLALYVRVILAFSIIMVTSTPRGPFSPSKIIWEVSSTSWTVWIA